MAVNADLDPEIAKLLEIQSDETDILSEDFSSLQAKPIQKTEIGRIDIQKLLIDKNYYIKIIKEGREYGQKINDLLSKYIKAELKDNKSMYREKIIPSYWNMLLYLIDNFFDNINDEKKALFRYGLLNTTFIDENQKRILLDLNNITNTNKDIYFVDEWLFMVGNGKIKQSSIDETKILKKNTPSVMRSKLEGKIGAREAELTSLSQKVEQHLMIERSLKSSVSIILNHQKSTKYNDLIAPYDIDQKKTIIQIQDILKSLLKSDKEIESTYNNIKLLDDEIQTLNTKSGEFQVQIDTKTIRDEFLTLRQMVKMTIGRQGNHFPFLIKAYMPSILNEVCTKENLEGVLREIESIDPGIFKRTYKQKEHRIIPYFLIVPSFGDFGICWQPFERMNKATSKGRITIPMFPRDLKTSILYGLGDLRWQIAKEKALYHWMEEGLTGHYYDYVQTNKLKGDLKEMFIQDYILWIRFESQGMQKLNKEVRSIFWRYIPFPIEIKEALKNRGYYYSELYRKDQNRSISRGY